MIRNISVGIDIGTHSTKVVVGEFVKGEKYPKIIGIGENSTLGMRHGYVVSPSLVTESIKNAVTQAEKTSGIKIRRAYIAIGGVTLRGNIAPGVAIVSKADGEVTVLDVNKALDECEENVNLGNKKVIQISPVAFRLDGKEVLGRPEGMHGNKLETRAMVVTVSNQHLDELVGAIADAGITPIDLIVSPLAASNIAITEKQKIVGCALVNIGSETVTLSVFENNTLIALHTFSIGSSDITNDVALGLKITLEEAEMLKLGTTNHEYSKKKLDEIIEARLGDIFELIENLLKKIKRSELLPAGVIFIGGGANMPNIEILSKASLKLPSKIAMPEMLGNTKTKLRDPSWYTALGLLMHDKDTETYSDSSTFNIWKNIKSALKSGIKQLKP